MSQPHGGILIIDDINCKKAEEADSKVCLFDYIV